METDTTVHLTWQEATMESFIQRSIQEGHGVSGGAADDNLDFTLNEVAVLFGAGITPTVWKNVLWSDEIKIIDSLENHFVWWKTDTAHPTETNIATVEHGGSNVMLWESLSSERKGKGSLSE